MSNEKNIVDPFANKEKHQGISQNFCRHGCNKKFKTKKQKILHHNKLDTECRREKFYLITLIQEFHKTLEFLLEEYKSEDNSDYEYFKLLLKNAQKNVIDKEQFGGIVQLN